MQLIGIGDDKPLELRLAQAIAWCAPRADPDDPSGSLRNLQLRPSVLGPDRRETVLDVVKTREQWDRACRDVQAIETLDDLGDGRMLLYFPDEQLADGAAEDETSGYFDVENAPPWDTWVALFASDKWGEYLVSWVPGPFVDLVGRGIQVNPEECILWLADSHVPVAEDLRSRRLLR